MEKLKFKEGDIFHDGLLGYWIFITHKKKLALYPFEYYNKGKLQEGSGHGCCSFIHDTKDWRNIEKLKILGNYNDGFNPKPKGIFEELKKAYVMGPAYLKDEKNGINRK